MADLTKSEWEELTEAAASVVVAANAAIERDRPAWTGVRGAWDILLDRHPILHRMEAYFEFPDVDSWSD